MSELAPKAQWFPDQPFGFRDKEGPRSNFSIGLMRYKDGVGQGCAVRVDWPLTVIAQEEADAADPQNQLRRYVVRVGDTLAYSATFTDVAESAIEPDFRRFLMAVMVMIGVEHGDEIKAAIAAEREGAAEAA